MVNKVKTWGGEQKHQYYSVLEQFALDGSVTLTRYPASGSYTYGLNYSSYLNFKQRSWYTTANWKTLRKTQGYLTTLPLVESQKEIKQRLPVVTYTNWQRKERWTKYGEAVYVPSSDSLLFPLAVRTDTRKKAKYKALSKARDMKVNVAVLFGEGRQTVRMIAETARTLGRAYSQFRKGQFSRAAKTLGIKKPSGTAANNWLSYSYGWSPLISDAKGMAELAAQQVALNGRPKRFTASGSQAVQSEFIYMLKGVGSVPQADCSDTRVMGVQTMQARAGLLCEVQHTESNLAAQMGLGLWDPLLTMWELTPFSFVFDWFVDIGSWLEALSSLQGVRVLAGFDGYWSQFLGTAATVNVRGNWTASGLSPIPVRCRDAQRDNWTGSVPMIKTPLYDGLNARRLVTSASLIRQRVRDLEPSPYTPIRKGKWVGRMPG